MQLRIGPNRVGAKGWLQPIADALKLMTKEIIFPSKANIYPITHYTSKDGIVIIRYI
jgi:NADH:ubiquinone oxidoreductase subunit H